MRIGPLEINWSPRRKDIDDTVWNRSHRGAVRLGYLTPEQLREELHVIKFEIRKGTQYRVCKDQRELITTHGKQR